MRRNIQRWWRNIGGNIGGHRASPNTSHPCRTYIRPPSDFILYSDTTNNLHSYHYHYQPAPCAIYHSTTRAHHTPHMFHVIGQSYCACTSSQGHGFQSWQGLVRIWVSILWHPLEYESFHYMFILLPYALQVNSLYVHVSLCINTPAVVCILLVQIST